MEAWEAVSRFQVSGFKFQGFRCRRATQRRDSSRGVGFGVWRVGFRVWDLGYSGGASPVASRRAAGVRRPENRSSIEAQVRGFVRANAPQRGPFSDPRFSPPTAYRNVHLDTELRKTGADLCAQTTGKSLETASEHPLHSAGASKTLPQPPGVILDVPFSCPRRSADTRLCPSGSAAPPRTAVCPGCR